MKRSTIRFTALFLLAGTLFVSCEKEEKDALVVPDTYDGAAFTANTSAQAALRLQLEQLTNEMKKGRVNGVKVEASVLNALYTGGSPSLQSATTSYYNSRLTGPGGWLEELSKASGSVYAPSAPNGSQGGAYGGYLFDENGLELEQLVEKGLFGAALYHQAALLAKKPLTPASVDQMLSLFGAHPEFPNTSTALKTSNPDKFLALYAARRDKNNGAGLYTQMKQAFITLQAAVKAGDVYKEEQQAALRTLFETWEKVNAATVINYCHQTVSVLSATNPTDAQKAGALHAYSEGVGFLHGWRTVPSDFRIANDAKLDQLLALMNAPYNGTPTSYKFVTDAFTELPKLSQIIQELKTLYKFSDQEVEDFRKNWISEQGR